MTRNIDGSSTVTEATAAKVPEGYRSGIITITVLLGFSLSFLHYWGFEAAGDWTLRSIASTGTLVFAIALQIFALFRSLRIEDSEAAEYRKTVTWFTASAIAMLLGLLLAGLEYSRTAAP
jgi:NO-binding membrane sensor protein with MHYT domain